MRRLAVMMAMALFSLAALTGCVGSAEGGRAIEGPVLAVLAYSPDEVILIEPESLSVIKHVRLRSMGTDPVALPGRRTFVTAQCGGVGDEADDAIALIDLRQSGRVRYVDLPEPNPGQVVAVHGDAVLVSCGMWDPDGIPVMRVDLEGGATVSRATVANAYDRLVVAAQSLWTIGPEGPEIDTPVFTTRRTTLDLAASQVVPVDGEPLLIAPDGESTSTILAVRITGGVTSVSRLSAVTLEVIDSCAVDGLRNGIWQVVEAGDLLVLRDSSGVDMSDPGGPLIVLDRATLRELRRIDVGGSVASIAAIGTTLYAVTWDSGELVKVDPVSGAVLQRVLLKGLDGTMLQLAAMDAASSANGQ